MPESVVLDVMRVIQLALHHKSVRKVLVTVSPAVAFQILNEKRIAISQIEEESKKTVVISGDPNFTSDQVDYVCQDGRGRQVQAVPSILA
jgi:Ribonuclease G/E